MSGLAISSSWSLIIRSKASRVYQRVLPGRKPSANRLKSPVSPATLPFTPFTTKSFRLDRSCPIGPVSASMKPPPKRVCPAVMENRSESISCDTSPPLALLPLAPLLLPSRSKSATSDASFSPLAARAPQQLLAAQEQDLPAASCISCRRSTFPGVEVRERQQLAPPERMRRRHAGDLRHSKKMRGDSWSWLRCLRSQSGPRSPSRRSPWPPPG